MRFRIDDLEVFFPYDRMYLEQYQYMRSIKQALDAEGHALLEMPTGTGKTVCLLSLITSYQYANPSAGKLVYCTRTVPEMNAVMEELGVVLAYRAKELGLDVIPSAETETVNGVSQEGSASSSVPSSTGVSSGGNTMDIEDVAGAHSSSFSKPNKKRKIYKRKQKKDPNLGPISNNGNGAGGSGALALCLSSRRNMCVHDRVLHESDREAVDAACRSMTASWVVEKAKSSPGSIETCEYYDNFQTAGEATSLPSGIFDLDNLKIWGKNKGWCPYYLTRQAINHANILVFNYQYMLDPKVARMVSKELEAESIIVFDEAHNIDSVCIEALSVTINDRALEQATRSLGRLSSEVSRIKATDSNRLQIEYRNLVNGLIEQGILDTPTNDAAMTSNVLAPDVLNESVPGNIRRAEHFIGFMKKLVEHLKARLRTVAGPNGGVQSETPLAFLHRMMNNTSLEAKPLKFAYSRLNSLLRTLQVSNLDDFNSLSDVADFATLLSTYSEGVPRFAIILEPNGTTIPGVTDPVIQLACLDASLAIAPLFKRFGSVVITSGTLSPIDLYPKLLQFEPRVSESLNLSTFRPCIRPLVITRGSDQMAMSTKFDDRGDMGVVRNYGAMLVQLCAAIPDGVVAFFTSYSYMESIISEWDAMGILRQLTKHKLVFIETKDVVETTLALDNYRRACDSGRGAVFLSVARGKVSEGINFDRHYGRAVIMFGIPFQYTLSHVLRARLEYLQTHFQIREADFLNFDAIRQTSQCLGRVIRSKTDYGLMILADSRYNRADKRSKLPKWIQQFLSEGYLNLSTDTAIQYVKQFLRVMGQPVDQEALQSVLLPLEEVERLAELTAPQESSTDLLTETNTTV
uniref:DNA 5'-3' helicase n=2 Tax=Chaetoceros debilis TaxID=122233 RepID=A0A7S3V8A6_9STRA|mmetsp:Transcript_222/g.406  ORF Transcript_222/g.406 Transcript_222/m.406 type:complete len:859 (-) Transcript_222:1262-3838(-)|eukprot:CAMPEP_0194096274 /NCGR_PEP_ID=MMETSP0149-20130528/57256_1 /TAXON_ID=122233 /ORGANISM="Chaetoceros debilis, Strain MM31A-1" /LENGTH=858 /DNA_ID=CAMNT_0038782243 /DNA_START=111 /DNA_END=2687 /DNA_ORIENTATION=+